MTAGFDGRAARYEELRPIDDNWWEVYEALVRLGRASRPAGARGRLRHGPGRAGAGGARACPRLGGRRLRGDGRAGQGARRQRPRRPGRGAAVQGRLVRRRRHADGAPPRSTGPARSSRRGACSARRARLAIATEDPDSFEDVWFTRFFPSVPEIERGRFPGADALRLELANAGFQSVADRAPPPAPRADARARRRRDPLEGLLDLRPPRPGRVRGRARPRRGRAARQVRVSTSTGSWCPPRDAQRLPARVGRARAGRARDASARRRPDGPGHEPPRADPVDRQTRRGRHRSLLEAHDRPRVRPRPLVLGQGARGGIALAARLRRDRGGLARRGRRSRCGTANGRSGRSAWSRAGSRCSP